jgi:XisH protein
LQNDGWTITHDPFLIPINSKGVYADLGAEKTIAAEREKDLIVVEVKSLIGLSVVTDFYSIIGKYELYFQALKKFFPERKLYVAIPEKGYKNLIKDPFFEEVLINLDIKLIIFTTEKEQIVKWIK